MSLSRQEIARAGLRLLNQVGLNGLTLRLIAGELGVKAPALYWHLKNKQELLDEMATQMYRDALPDRPALGAPEDWERSLADLARAMRAMMLKYRDGAKVFSGTFFTDETLPNEHMLRQMIDAGIEPRRAGRVLFTLYNYIIGFTIEEQAVHPMPGERDERYDAVLRKVKETDDPKLAALVTDGMFSDEVDSRFEDGVEIILTGSRVWLS